MQDFHPVKSHAGGVIQLFTREGKSPATMELRTLGGSDGARKFDVNAQGKYAGIGYVFDVSRFHTDGYRRHSAATRDQAFAKLTFAPDSASRLTLLANNLHQRDTQDPLGVRWASFQRDPRGGEIDATDTASPARTLAERYNTRKSIDHRQIGVSYERRFGQHRLHLMTYGGNRDVIQYQAFSPGFQAAPSHSGGVVDFARDFYGADLHWIHRAALASGTLDTTVGFDVNHSRDLRRGYENFIGSQLGVRGRLRRDEVDLVTSADPYLQAEWQSGPWILTGGLRHNRIRVRVRDRYRSNGDDSGGSDYRHTTPLLAALYKVAPTLNVYASAAQGFEAPTLNELFYSPTGAGVNFALEPARSVHLEAGVKAIVGSDTRLNAALFQIRTRDELVVATSSGGRTSYRNASQTSRQGIELSLDTSWNNGFGARLALSALHAVVANARPTTRLPGVPAAQLFGELAWRAKGERFGAALEAIASGKVYPDDANREVPAPGYAVLNLRVQASQSHAGWRFKQFARINNLLDRRYVGSLIVGDANQRFYEAAPGRNWLLGASAQYAFD